MSTDNLIFFYLFSFAQLLMIPIAIRNTRIATPNVSKSLEINSNIVYPFLWSVVLLLNPTILFGIVQ